jgi:hypothetical protein
MPWDLWDVQQSAHAQIIDLQTGKEAATQILLQHLRNAGLPKECEVTVVTWARVGP